MILDLVAGLAFVVAAVAIFVLHILTTDKHGIWLNLPGYVRIGLFTTGLALLYRGVDLLTLSRATILLPGQADGPTLAGALSVAYTMSAMAIYTARRIYPARVWKRMRFIERLATCGSQGAALAELETRGFKVVTKPEDLEFS